MNVKIDIHDIIIKDAKTGQERKVRTLRSAEDIANYIDETENERIWEYVNESVLEALNDNQDGSAESAKQEPK